MTSASSRSLDTPLITAFLFAFLFVVLATPGLIRRRWGQPIREDGPERHRTKAGTPTLGGVVILASILAGMGLFGLLSSLWPLVFVLIAFGALGFYDDWTKISKGKGITARTKLALQWLLALGMAWLLYFWLEDHAYHIPFSESTFRLGLGFIPFTALVMVGASNAVNLTDGLDGLVAVPVALLAAAFGLLAYSCGMAELALFCALMAGGLAGFLWFNAHPAEIFMGDTGALALGALLASVAVLLRQELLLAVMGGLFVLEALSVILQVVYFKRTKKRIFRMAPLHHHFELKGWPENKVVVRFWLISLLFVLVGLAGA